MNSVVLNGVLAFVASAALTYVFMRRAVLNFGDPLVFINVSIPFSAALLAVLCVSGLVSYSTLVLFFSVLIGYLIGARIASAFFCVSTIRISLRRSIDRLSRIELVLLHFITLITTFVLAILAFKAGAQGDARQDFDRAFRPLVVLQNGLFILSLVSLLSSKLTKSYIGVWIFCLVVLSIAFSGKSVLLPVFYWFGLYYFVNNKPAKLSTVALLIFGVFLGVALMGLIAYRITGPAGVFALIGNRLWLSGDVYIYAYQMDALTSLRYSYPASFFAYVLHPISSLFGVRGYERPLGSMIMSFVVGDDVLTGPNPQLPVLLDFFFPDQLALATLIASFFGLGVFGIRAIALRAVGSRSKFIGIGAMAIAIFCPATGFVDTSQVLILMVSILVASAAMSVVEMLSLRRVDPRLYAHPIEKGR